MPEECASCGAVFGSTQELIQHVHAHSDAPGGELAPMNAPDQPGHVYPCLLCGAEFRTPQALALHNLEPHGTPAPASRAPRTRRRDLVDRGP